MDAMGELCNQTSIQFVENLAGLADRPSVLDVGCGAGTFLELFSRTFLGATCVGVDVSSKQIEVARGNPHHQGLTFVEGDITQLERLCGRVQKQYDLVITRYVISNLGQQKIGQAVDSSMERVKPGGWVVFQEVSAHQTYHAEPEIPRPMKAWSEVVERILRLMQNTRRDTAEAIQSHLNGRGWRPGVSHRNLIADTPTKKRVFVMGVELTVQLAIEDRLPKELFEPYQVNSSIELLKKVTGYSSLQDWIKEIHAFQASDQVLTIKNFIIVSARKTLEMS